MNQASGLGLRASGVLVLCALVATACGGDDGGTTSPTPGPPTTNAQNPCPPARSVQASLDGAQSEKARQPLWADPRGTLGDILWRHQATGGRAAPLAVDVPTSSADVGEIAVIQDEGDLVAPGNAFDLHGVGLRFSPRNGGYDVSRIDAAFQSSIGDPLTLQDDDSVSRPMPFGFTFYNTAQSTAFINSDGNITFGEGDNASTTRAVGRILAGAPRVAPFFADLDPSDAGAVYLRSVSDVFTVTWCGVAVFDSSRRATFQTTLLPNGTIEMKYAAAAAFTAADGIAAIAPGRGGNLAPVDLSAVSGSFNAGATGERFSLRASLDLVAVARRFYASHADRFDQLLVWTDDVMTPENAFAFEATVANDIAGIGVEMFNLAPQFNSAGRLNSLVQMDAISKYPDDPTTTFLGENNTLSIVGQEVGHRWLSYMQFSDHNRRASNAWLGRDSSHWSFFFNSDASVMEGNRIEDLGSGSFRTTAAVEKYSLIDQYAMGLVRDIDVPKMFYVENPVNVSSSANPESGPRVGVTFSGTRRDILINDVVEVMGARSPSADAAPKLYRQAFLFVVSRGRTASPAAIAKIDRIRQAWEPFYARATDSRGRVETRLQAGS